MAVSLEEIEKQARLLTKRDRAVLARTLISDLDPTVDQDVEKAWIAECERRYAAFRRGEIEAWPGDDVMERTRERIR